MTFLNQTRVTEAPSADEIDFHEAFALLRENILLIAVIAAVVFFAGIAYAILGTPIYRADAVIQVDDDPASDSLNDKLGELASLFQAKATADAEIELIRSRTVVSESVTRLHLDVDSSPHYFPLIGAAIVRYTAPDRGLANPLFGLSRFAWGGERISVTQFDVPARLYDRKFSLVNADGQEYELIDPDGNVVLHGRVGELESGMVATGRDSVEPVQLRVASLLSRPGTRFDLIRHSTQQTVADLQKALNIAEVAKQSGIIGVKLDGPDADRVTATINTIASLYVQRNVDGKSAQAQQMLSFLGDQLPQLRADLDRSEARYNAYRAKSGVIDLDEQGKLLLQSGADIKVRLTELQQQRAELVQRYTSAHPLVTAIDARIAELEQEQRSEERQTNGLPAAQQQALGLMREVKVNTDLYMKLLDSTQQLRVLKAGQLGNVRTVDFAVVPEKPVRPLKVLVVALAAALGLLIGCAVAYGRRVLNGGLATPAEVERALDMPVYAMISHSDKQMALAASARRNPSRPAVLAAAFPDDVAVEGLRSVRTALQFGILRPATNIVMLTGPRPGVGKSFVALNLATVLATAGKRILLIDGDMRRGDVHSYFALDRKPGLSDVIAGADPASVIHKQVLPDLDVMVAGSVPDRPAELLTQDRVGQVLKQIAEAYDLVIIDSPPALAVTDPVLIGKHAGAVLMVVRHARHSAAELRECLRQFASGGIHVDGVLMNDVSARGASYGAYSTYQTRAD
jgi:tyrosine-protein kinase Etk/Wzc